MNFRRAFFIFIFDFYIYFLFWLSVNRSPEILRTFVINWFFFFWHITFINKWFFIFNLIINFRRLINCPPEFFRVYLVFRVNIINYWIDLDNIIIGNLFIQIWKLVFFWRIEWVKLLKILLQKIDLNSFKIHPLFFENSVFSCLVPIFYIHPIFILFVHSHAFAILVPLQSLVIFDFIKSILLQNLCIFYFFFVLNCIF